MRHHQAGFEAGVAGEEGGQVLVERRVHQAVDAALGDAGQGGERDREEVELKRQRLAVEIAAGKDLAVEDERIVGGGVQLDGEDAGGFGERVADGAVDLRSAAERVSVLHAAAGDVGLADLAAFEQIAEAAGALELAGMRPDGVDAVVEGARSAAKRIKRERANDIGGIGENLRGVEFEAADGEHGLRAVDQADAFLGVQLDRRRCRRGGGRRRRGGSRP